jgi:Icc-related predicted phosphoesterase
MNASTEPGRLLVAGDVHGNIAWIRTLCDFAVEHGCSAILQLGDFGYWPHYPDGVRFMAQVGKHARRTGVSIYWIDGNHENHDALSALDVSDGFVAVGERCFYIPRGHRWTWSGVRFGALGGAFSIDWRDRKPGTSWWPEEVTTPADVERLGTAPLDVLVTHEAPAGVPLEGYRLPAGDAIRAQQVRQCVRAATEATRPKLVLHGHWHRRNSYELTWPVEHCGELVWRSALVEGLAADVQGDRRAWGVLALEPLCFSGGDSFRRS